MSKRLDITVSDAIYDAIIDRAAIDGFANDRDHGKRQLVVRALTYWLSQRGYEAIVLHMDDETYAKQEKIASTYL